ncbi:MAG TPA: exosortase E/protease, VPEID-CTERM system [Bryobacteraceae bacterium]|nr:exosortase E/protease, VPEID-CTERM system [Bryobacteraceae bacterium]
MIGARVSSGEPAAKDSILAKREPIPPADSLTAPRPALGLAARLTSLALLLGIEGILITNLVHRYHGNWALLRVATVCGSLLLAISYAKSRPLFRQVSNELKRLPIGWPLLAGHFAALLLFVVVSFPSLEKYAPAALVAALWYGTGALALGLAGSALLPPGAAWKLVRDTGYAWTYALAAGLIGNWLVVYSQLWNGAIWNPALELSWKPATDFTFRLVHALLRLFLPHVIADPTSMTIGTPAFSVTILPWCAGFEGTALMLVFSVAWLSFFRREFRFPQALLLIPAGMAVMWMSNAVRITALILIGVAGAPNVAVGGFHSQAGWMAFNCVALGLVTLSRRVPWMVRRLPEAPLVEAREHNPSAAYLMPFLILLAASMISRAASSSGFEWPYPLRFVAVAATLWFFRARYTELDWRFSWFSAGAGCVVLGLWLGLDRWAGAPQDNAIAAGLAAWPYWGRLAWLTMRTAAAVTTVPIAEELAFRGFLIRRIISSDFESLDPRRYTWTAVLVSSLAFGSLHGPRWIAGTLAGLIYAIVYLRRGKLGDAVVAHAVTNALLALFVLLTGKWDLW